MTAQARGEAAIEESGGGVEGPVEAARVGAERLVLGRETGPEIHDVEARPGRELERKVQRFGGHERLSVTHGERAGPRRRGPLFA